ncbi:hypothetical protein FNH22_23165 [Fulvivirga sp. M361]|uniref:hypothetical protein n=1 Tax=Fulvivirga sp. M361 TaxID=2594266 RepID=UPI00117A35A7|nr:hypothetical protein [Fulvivirga sp. M361]TRX51857.1 hypothetical protein FNH22_23165 [Fulvivirga sp. M361]
MNIANKKIIGSALALFVVMFNLSAQDYDYAVDFADCFDENNRSVGPIMVGYPLDTTKNLRVWIEGGSRTGATLTTNGYNGYVQSFTLTWNRNSDETFARVYVRPPYDMIPDLSRTFLFFRSPPKADHPGGLSVENTSPIVLNSGQQDITVNVDWNASRFSNSDRVNLIKIYVNGLYKSQVTNPGSTVPVKLGPGRHTIALDFIQDWGDGLKCGLSNNRPTLSLEVKPACEDDDFRLTLAEIDGTQLIEEEGGFLLDSGVFYTIVPINLNNDGDITDFTDYTINPPGGPEVTYDDTRQTIRINKSIGSYLLSASGYCPTISAKLFLGGSDKTYAKQCDFILPEGLPDYDPTNDGFKHFAATIQSQTQIVVKPGLKLSQGAELFLEVAPPQNLGPGRDRNFIETLSFDEFNQKMAHERQYFDDMGRPTQTQTVDINNEVIFAEEVLYDEYGRPVIETLEAPVKVLSEIEVITDECKDDNGENGVVKYVDFSYEEGFVKDQNGQTYDYTNFSLDKMENPDAVGKQEYTLGWYYSDKNGTSSVAELNETNVPQTQFPYFRTLFHDDGTEEVKGVTKPGDEHRAGSGHISFTDRGEVEAEDPLLIKYFEMREEAGLPTPASLEGNFYYVENTDINGSIPAPGETTKRRSKVIYDQAENPLIEVLFDDLDKVVTKSYQFYDLVGRLKVLVSPNGVVQFENEEPEKKVGYDHIDKTTYYYDFHGRLIRSAEPDAGETRFIYRNDGSIRFSQNTKQLANGGRYSYTNYDEIGRVIESGEYLPLNTQDITFGSQSMKNILEITTENGGLPDKMINGKPNKNDRTMTHFDIPMQVQSLPDTMEQRFTHGAISWTKNKNVTTFYSYDELGRIVWMLQEIDGLGDKLLEYRYSIFGSVREVAYQRGKFDQFYHYFDYDKTGRLYKAYTSQVAPEYGQNGEIVNSEVLNLQATYKYYLHGPLKRIELAQNLQGIDFVYNIHGWITGINHPNVAKDPGQDGDPTGENGSFQEDAFGLLLDYYERQIRNTQAPTAKMLDTGRFHGLPGNAGSGKASDVTVKFQD